MKAKGYLWASFHDIWSLSKSSRLDIHKAILKNYLYAKINTTLSLYLWQIFIFLLGHLHFFLHFSFSFMVNLFKKHPIYIPLSLFPSFYLSIEWCSRMVHRIFRLCISFRQQLQSQQFLPLLFLTRVQLISFNISRVLKRICGSNGLSGFTLEVPIQFCPPFNRWHGVWVDAL